MNEILASALRDAVYQRLDYLDRLVAEADLRSRAALADTEIVWMTAAWRALLVAHQPDGDGRCPRCSGLCRRRRPPCSVWTTAHQHLLTADIPAAAQTERHTTAPERPTFAHRWPPDLAGYLPESDPRMTESGHIHSSEVHSMPARLHEHPTGACTFPSSDHFPLGRAYGRVDAEPAQASKVRPFGLTLAVQPRMNIRFDPAELGYDDERQIGLIREGGTMVPLSKHTDGTTNTQTNADGRSGPDSDTDHRED